MKALEGLGLDESDEEGQDGNILPLMQSIMQNLLSKEVLYPPLKEITAKVLPLFVPQTRFLFEAFPVTAALLPSTQSGWRPTSRASALRTTSATSSRLRSWETSVRFSKAGTRELKRRRKTLRA